MTRGYASVSGGKWHRTIADQPSFTRDEQTVCGLTIRPLNVSWNGKRPDYAHPSSFCKRCDGMIEKEIKQRLEYLRSMVRGECISYDELHELQCLAEHIEEDDVELLQAAGVPEFDAE